MADPGPGPGPGPGHAPGPDRSGGAGAPGEEGYEPRGVENPRIVDLITVDPERDEVVLAILEPRRWAAEAAAARRQLEQLEDKLNSYFAYVLDGFLVRDYPAYDGMPVAVRLDCAEEPGEEQKPFLAAATRFAAAHGMRFLVRAVDDPFEAKAPWER